MAIEESLFWMMRETRLSGVTEAGRISDQDVLREPSEWVNLGTKGAEMEIFLLIRLVSVCHVDFAELSLLTQELVIFLFKNLISLSLDGSRFLNLSF